MTMAYTLEQLAADIANALRADPGPAGKGEVCRFVARALNDPAFVATHLKDRAPGADPREILYEDPGLGFCICGHVYDRPANSPPHDHGSSWAIYGQAAGVTEMTDWRIVETGRDGKPSLAEPVRTYLMHPGDVHFYDVRDVHAPRRAGPVKLIRIEGQNLDRVQRSNIKPVAAAASS
jgi:predicted metal-dependent enzyme (double-stranded beta helix superfamily)